MEVKDKTKRLGQLRSLRAEINLLSQRMAEMELRAGADIIRVTGLPIIKRNDRADNYAAKIESMHATLERRRELCMDELGRLYRFIDNIDDSLMRRIMTYRYVDGLSWRQVAFKIGECDEQYPRRKHNEFLAFAKIDENDEGELILSKCKRDCLRNLKR